MIEIVLATYNGERYLREQLDSILAQTYDNWILTVQDDCSTDKTPEILVEYQHLCPDKIKILPGNRHYGCAKDNFFSLLLQSTAPYIMCSDQDDVWLANKLEVTLKKMQETEGTQIGRMPVLVHTDLSVVDDRLQMIAVSMAHLQKIDPTRTAPRQLVAQNNVTGCTMMINRALLCMLGETPPHDAIMHDWWLALLAACFGKIAYVYFPTILYRQHDNNAVGAKNTRSLVCNLRVARHPSLIKENLLATCRQAACFLELYKPLLPDAYRRMLSEYAAIPHKNKLGRCATVLRLGALKYGLMRKLVTFFYI